MKSCEAVKSTSYLKTQAGSDLLKILALSRNEIKKGNFKSLNESFSNNRKRIYTLKQTQNKIQG